MLAIPRVFPNIYWNSRYEIHKFTPFIGFINTVLMSYALMLSPS